MLAVKRKLMLFDEPTAALDPELRQEVLHVRTRLREFLRHVIDHARRGWCSKHSASRA